MSKLLLLLVPLAAAVLLIACSSFAQSHQDAADQVQPAVPRPNPQKSARSQFQLPKLFDFEYYKRTFKKIYSSGLEEAARRKYMLARAFRAFVSAVKYKWRTSSHFNALNFFSDRSPAELEAAENKRIPDEILGVDVGELPSERSRRHGRPVKDSLPADDPSAVEDELELLTADHDHELKSAEEKEGLNLIRSELKAQVEAEQQNGKLRRKRDLKLGRPMRELPLDKLIATGDENAKLDPEAQRKVQDRPESNNPDYEAPELASYGLRSEKVQNVDWYSFKTQTESKKNEKAKQSQSDGSKSRGWLSFLDKSAASEEEQFVDANSPADLPDEVFFDHRDSECMFLPRHQGNCGSCYAFVVTTIAEWLYCKRKGKLVAFSEQYMVDCGKPVGLGGCEGGFYNTGANFVHNYGMELRVNYPYAAHEQQCPYDDDTDPKRTGYIRMELGSGLQVPVHMLEDYIHLSPAYLSISTKGGFHEYGGGVLKGEGCLEKGTHAVTLIGHGREDGLEYWLIRNSYSVGWGEQGHFKMWKGSDCIYPRVAAFFGTKDGQRVHVRPEVNRRNNGAAVRGLYGANLHKQLHPDEEEDEEEEEFYDA